MSVNWEQEGMSPGLVGKRALRKALRIASLMLEALSAISLGNCDSFY